MVAHDAAIDHNVATMAAFCARAGVDLAPHAKTSMSPQVISRQLAAGAWGMTAATVAQVAVLRSFGVPVILMANLVVDERSVRWLAEHVLDEPGVRFFCYVDSPESVHLLDRVLAPTGSRLDVLLEVGFHGGRTGVRTLARALEVAAAVRGAGALRLRGVAGFEGLAPGFADGVVPQAVPDLLQRVHGVVCSLHEGDLFEPGELPIVTAGGSSFFDAVVAELGPHRFPFPVRTVLRSGCYVAHDHGVYQRTSPMDGRAGDGDRFRPALELLASVLSRPEPDLVIVGCGRRDVPTDEALPVPLGLFGAPSDRLGPGPATSVAVNDHHLFVRVDPRSELAVGDVLRLGISHPCGAFDRWREIPLVDADHRLVGVLEQHLG
jgi:D-serine deaminase-like pyridoxal phosphate-dependent protein